MQKNTNSRGGRFTINIISKILSNRRYIGEYIFRDIVKPGGIPAIIDTALFDRVQHKLEQNKHAAAKYKADDEYILTTKLYCGKCKSFMVGESGVNHQGTKYRYYKCIDAKRGRGCDKKAVNKDEIENAVLNVVIATLSNDDYVESLIDSLMKMQESENTTLKLLQQELSKVEKKIKNMISAIEQGIITRSTKQRLDELESTRDNLETEIAKESMTHPIMDREFLQYWFKDFKKLNTEDLENRRMLINTFVNSVVLYDDRFDFYFNYKDNVKTLKLSEIESLSDLASPTPPTKQSRKWFLFLISGN